MIVILSTTIMMEIMLIIVITMAMRIENARTLKTHIINEESNGNIAEFSLISFVTFKGCIAAVNGELKFH